MSSKTHRSPLNPWKRHSYAHVSSLHSSMPGMRGTDLKREEAEIKKRGGLGRLKFTRRFSLPNTHFLLVSRRKTWRPAEPSSSSLGTKSRTPAGGSDKAPRSKRSPEPSPARCAFSVTSAVIVVSPGAATSRAARRVSGLPLDDFLASSSIRLTE